MNVLEVIVGSSKLIEGVIKLSELGEVLYKRLDPLLRRAPAADYTNAFIQEVIDIQDAGGTKTLLEKRQRIRMGQSELAIVRDGHWGTGNQLASYRVHGARRIGIKREGLRTTMLLAIEPGPKPGEEHEIRMTRAMRNMYPDEHGYFDLMAERPTGSLSLRVLFPKKRPPRAAHLIEWPSERLVQRIPLRYSSERRPFLMWKKLKPKPMQAYSLRWIW